VRGWNVATASTTADILQSLTRHEPRLRALGVRRLALFGSAVRGELRDTSDLDFVVEFDRKSFDAYMDLKAFLEELFGRKVDLVIAEAIKPRLRHAILGEAVHAPGL
jgi:predicted nucleotidyltransferase